MIPNIALRRLHNQRLHQNPLHTPRDVVAWMGAVQSQDYAGAKWALGLRMHTATDNAVDQAFQAGHILRTHVLRPTWHFVTPADIRWLLALTAPRVHARLAHNYRQLALDGVVFARSEAALAKALEGGNQCTRAELAAALVQAGIAVEGLRLGHLLMHAELEGVICSGARRGKQFTYALLDERAPQAANRTRDEALAELVARYFTSHGPATVQDFTWWSGLTQADAKAGIDMVKPLLMQETIEGKLYWQAAPRSVDPVVASALLLPAYDEYTVAYKDRRAILDPAHVQQVGFGVIDSVLVIDGQALGNWKRRVTKDAVVVEVTPFGPLNAAQAEALAGAAHRYGDFLNMPVVVLKQRT